jgi:pimeloyl-ACP methyl ester carboxylesterase
VTADAAVSSFDVAGPDDAPAIVFVHGTRLTRAAWGPQVDGLRDAFRVVTMDLPGHGALAGQPFTLGAASDELARVIEAAGSGRAIVVGLSLGGYVAMDLAARRPGLIRGLVLAGASQEPVGWRAVPYQALAFLMDRVEQRRFERLNAWFFRTRFAPPIAEPIVTGGFYSGAGAQALRSLIGESFVPRLAAYEGPTLILNGQFDPIFRLGAGRFAGAARDARRVRVAGATHLVNLDRPAAFNLAVRRFAEGLADRS